MSVRVTRTDIDPSSRQPHTSELLAIPLDYLNGWLFGVNANRVKDDVRDKLIRYQKECYRVLAREFVQTAVSPTSSSSLMQVREMGLAIVRMAEEQMEFDRRLSHTETITRETAVLPPQSVPIPPTALKFPQSHPVAFGCDGRYKPQLPHQPTQPKRPLPDT